MRVVKGTIDWTFEPDDNQPLNVEAIDYRLEYTFIPGDPGCRYTKNGDGWPPEPPEVEWVATCLLLTTNSGAQRLPSGEEAALAKQWLESLDYDSDIVQSIVEAIIDRVEQQRIDDRW